MAFPYVPVVLGVAAGAVIGWIAYDEKAQRELAKLKSAATAKAKDLRLPMPEYAMHLPQDEEDFALLDSIVTKCVDALPEPAPGDTMGPRIDAARACVLEELYPDFPWPPMTGDHPTASQLFTAVEYEVVKKMVTQ